MAANPASYDNAAHRAACLAVAQQYGAGALLMLAGYTVNGMAQFARVAGGNLASVSSYLTSLFERPEIPEEMQIRYRLVSAMVAKYSFVHQPPRDAVKLREFWVAMGEVWEDESFESLELLSSLTALLYQELGVHLGVDAARILQSVSVREESAMFRGLR